MKFIRDRLNSLLNAAHKGTHEIIVSKDDANRIVVGDILSLVKKPKSLKKEDSN